MENLIQKCCDIKDYRIKYKSLKTAKKIRDAINEQRPLIARFDLTRAEWDKFFQFWEEGAPNLGKKVLTKEAI